MCIVELTFSPSQLVVLVMKDATGVHGHMLHDAT